MKKINTLSALDFEHTGDARHGDAHHHILILGAIGGGKTQVIHSIIATPRKSMRKTKKGVKK